MPRRSLIPADLAESLLGSQLKAVADHRRRAILQWLLGHRGVVEFQAIRQRFRMPAPTLSHHLATLERATLITTERRPDRSTVIRVSVRGVRELEARFKRWVALARPERAPATRVGVAGRKIRHLWK